MYERLGFHAVGEIAVHTGEWQVARATATASLFESPQTILDVDRRWLGCCRAAMLRSRCEHSFARAVSMTRAGVAGYGLATQQGPLTIVGPVLAEDEDTARSLVSTLVARIPAAHVRIDIPAEHTSFRAWLRDRGLHDRALRTEMARGADRLPWRARQRFALATQAWG